MSSEPVSDNQLDNVISFAKRSLGPTILSLMLELKSRRAQQAEPPAGCAEMAKAVADAIGDHLHGDYYATFDRDIELPVIQNVLAAKLAPLFTLLAKCRPRIVHEVTCATQDHEMYPKSTEVKTWLDSQVALLDKLDAALGKGDADGGREEG